MPESCCKGEGASTRVPDCTVTASTMESRCCTVNFQPYCAVVVVSLVLACQRYVAVVTSYITIVSQVEKFKLFSFILGAGISLVPFFLGPEREFNYALNRTETVQSSAFNFRLKRAWFTVSC